MSYVFYVSVFMLRRPPRSTLPDTLLPYTTLCRSQGMVAEMLWNGDGVERDRALADAWMDLAAERGYAGFHGLRERYWSALDEAGRARALEAGQEVYAHSGPAAPTPRKDPKSGV